MHKSDREKVMDELKNLAMCLGAKPLISVLTTTALVVEGYGPEKVRDACFKWVSEQKFFPKPAELLSTIKLGNTYGEKRDRVQPVAGRKVLPEYTTPPTDAELEAKYAELIHRKAVDDPNFLKKIYKGSKILDGHSGYPKAIKTVVSKMVPASTLKLWEQEVKKSNKVVV